MLFLILLICLFIPQSVFAVPNLQITLNPSIINSCGTTFPVTFIIENALSNSSYYYKFYGGIGSSNTQIQTSSSLSYTSDWTSFNTVNVDTGGSAVINSYAYIKPEVPSGDYNLYVRIALNPKTGDNWTTYTSPVSTFSVTLPSPTSTPIPIPTNTPISTNTPTPDPTKTNPDPSTIKITEFMPYSDPEWIEIYNKNDFPVKLVGWKIEDKEGHTRNIGNNGVLFINAMSYVVFEYSPFFDNTNAETVIVRDQNNSIVGQKSYDAGLRTLDRSWSFISDNWCQSSITKGYENVTSCYLAPTSTPIPINTPTPNPLTDTSKYTPDKSATESAIIEPISEPSFLIVSPTLEPTSNLSSDLVLGDTTSESSSKKNYLPLALIIGGGVLLVSPTVLTKIKPKK